MKRPTSIFDLFGGIRPMARALEESPSKIMAWKRAGHIPARKQATVLEKGNALGLSITAEHVVFPLGHPAPDLAGSETSVVCDENPKTQRKGRSQ